MMMFMSIEIECNNIVIRKEDINKYGIEIINDLNVHRIHDNCFRDNQNIVGEFIIPNNITKLGKYSFFNCSNLTQIIIPSSIKEIPYYCFDHCIQLQEVVIPENIIFKLHCFHNYISLSNESKNQIPENYRQ